MDKSKLVHLKNKYPGHYVGATGSCIEVIDKDDNLIVSLAKNAHGEYADRQHEVGARDAFDLAPIPKEARCFKLCKEGKVGKDELHDERKEVALAMLEEFGRVPSIEDFRKEGMWDEHAQRLLWKAKKKEGRKEEQGHE